MPKRSWVRVAGALALLAAVAACGGPPHGPAAPPAPTGPSGSPAGTTAAAAPPADPAAVWAKWGLQPLPAAPAAPADKPVKLSADGEVPVFSEVPTHDRVVFITVDDGAEKDPRFVEMMTDLRVPFSMFLTRDIVRGDYGYFKPLQALGNHIHNHSTDHPAMSTVSPERQHAEVCDAQAALTEQYGTAPLLFRPPYGDGAHSDGLRTAVRACGPRAVVLWRESMQIHNMQYQAADKKLRPGDIILAHFRGPKDLKGESMTKMFGELLSRIREQGFAVARLEDYIDAG
ncbi:hypothetical protein KNE206_22540 [Kitasatospora sp. NE20-6]|uniref:polysaccharide deacetylase family protein n=1 Tax=Kitasatospora sp. NE20-6 TaxID=2859066 RepID=UPI0034DBBBCA